MTGLTRQDFRTTNALIRTIFSDRSLNNTLLSHRPGSRPGENAWEKIMVRRRIIYLYLCLLAAQYAWNPFVPAPRPHSTPSRQPQSLGVREIKGPSGATLHMDDLNLIVQADGDGGDTAQRTGMFYFLYHDPNGFQQALEKLEVYPGIYVRHPAQRDFRSDPRRFSRDQQRPLIIAMGKYGMTDRLWRMFAGHVLRMGKYQNMDVIGPIGIGEYIRAFDAKLFYPLLLATDLNLFLSSLYLIAEASLDPNNVDDNNHVMTLLQARDVMPTPFGWLALKAYLELRPQNFGNTVLGKPHPVHGALAWYHRADAGGNPLLGEALFEELVKQ